MSYVILTFDVEDWFQVENLRPYCPPSGWDGYKLRVERSTHLLLDLLDSVPSATPPSSYPEKSFQHTSKAQQTPDSSHGNPYTKSTATFFILGWVAERLPGLVREIGNRGHEVASHGYGHELCSGLGSEELRADLSRSKKLLEDISGKPVNGYRAPGFSAGNAVLELVREAGYAYDSSFNSMDFNPRCGRIDLSQASRCGNAWSMPSGLVELPVSNLRLGSRSIPWGGGGYFRLYPLPLYLSGVRWILRQEGGFVFYLHPWEVDPEQPGIKGPGPVTRFRHYHNLDKTAGKLGRFLGSMRDCRVTGCYDYLRDLPAAGCEGGSLRGDQEWPLVRTSPERAG
jgi:polysaccharide deacetylase family protein (PEP-CTERM system associated)